jgi:hypothetical protein
MGINDEYSRDAYAYEQAHTSDEDGEEYDKNLHPEDWQDMYSNDLLDGWMHIREYTEDNYLRLIATFPDWNDFVLNPSQFFTFDPPSQFQIEIWNKISSITVISDRVSECHFFGWSKKNIRPY